MSETLGGLHEPPDAPPALESLSPPPSSLAEQARAALAERLGADGVRTDDRDRLMHSFGRSYRDLVAARSGSLDRVTDAVVYPADEPQVAGVLEIAERFGCAVIPFGGGTSVVGGVEPQRGRQQAVITLDTQRLDGVSIDAASHLAEIGAGVMGPDLERTLQAAGFTLGHFPQSFEFSTFGGWIAPRGAGQQSTRYGKIEEIIQAIRVVTPRGTIVTRNVPASATGPSMLQYVIGSEGTLGVIVSATARIRPLPAAKRYAAFLLPDFETGCELLRHFEQAELPLAVVRLSDAEETRWLFKSASSEPPLSRRLGRLYVDRAMRRRGYDASRTCIAIVSVEGDRPVVRLAVRSARTLAKRHRAIYLGSSPGQNWERDRFRLPYLRDELIARRLMVDTLETATTWTNLPKLYSAVMTALRDAMAAAGPPGVAMCHLSHLYPSGSSLYFTFLARQVKGRELEQWQQVKHAATAAIHTAGGTVSHHHGIGNEHLPLEAEHGPLAAACLAAVKAALDPTGIMNPGKLFADDKARD